MDDFLHSRAYCCIVVAMIFVSLYMLYRFILSV